MYGQGYVGTSQDVNRIRRQEKQREEQKKAFEELQKQKRDKVETAGLRQFGASKTEVLETAFKNETIGLVTREEFIQKRTTLQERVEEELQRKKREAEEAAISEKERRRQLKNKQAAKPKLSFLGDDEEEEQEVQTVGNKKSKAQPDDPGATGSDSDTLPGKKLKFSTLGKDPTVKTDFLPDKDRERLEEELREKLKKEWVAKQEALKAEPLEITYSYWDGQGHRRKIKVKKGDTISAFLRAVKEQLAPEFRELRASSVDNLLYIKEDLIMPHHYSFYDLIINKARGKSGPLFSFDVHEDIRLVNDASVEKNESHAGKVVERHWYDKNKHIFPANRWEVYDPEKKYDKYTIYGQ